MLVQLTDLHLRAPGQRSYGRFEAADFVRQAVCSVLRLEPRPLAVVITGDLTDFGAAAEYAHLAELIAPLPMPVYLLPGNHDDREQMRRSFPSDHWLGVEGEFIQYSIRVGGMRLIGLDTCEHGKPHGTLDTPRLRWLEEALQAAESDPVVIAMHHPPFETLIAAMDGYGLRQGGPEFEAIVAGHPNVERVICGHVHRAIDVRFGDTVACTTPSIAHQVALDFSGQPDATIQWTFEPPAYRMLALNSAGRVVTHIASTGDFDGPFSFKEGDEEARGAASR